MLYIVFYAIVFLLILVFSNVLNKMFPKLPLPLIQVLIGLVLGFFGGEKVLEVNPEVFLAFIIVPILFREAEESDIKRIFKYTRTILFLILPLVFLTALAIGYLTHTLYAAIPLAAAIALGGALAPTDAVVVSSLSERLSFPHRITAILKGEGLFNDASGLIIFQMAVLALTTGTFSIFNASVNLIYAAIGGAVIGLIIVWLNGLVLTVLEDVAAQDTAGYLLLEFTVPLAAYFLADMLDMSGIIAVIVAGIMQANGLKKSSLFDAQFVKVKNTVWETLSFILSSIVFIFLGLELFQLIRPVFVSRSFSNLTVIIMALVLTVALFAVRFVFLTVFYFITSLRAKKRFRYYWNDVLILTFTGVKGTIGIATILLLPRMATDQQALLVFLCAVVTGLSFLVGLFVVPIFAKAKNEKVDNLTKIAILTAVIEELEQDQKKAEKKTGYTIAIDAYQERIQKLIIEQESTSISTDFNDLQLLIMRMELEGLESALRENRISMYTYRTYQRYLHSLETTLVHHLVSSLQFALAVFFRGLYFVISNILHINIGHRVRRRNKDAWQTTHEEITELYFSNTELILQALENLEGVYDEKLINFLQNERLRTAAFVANGGHITRMMNKAHPNNLTEMMRAYYLERKVIFEYEEAGQLTSSEAQEMRKNVNVLEDYSLSGEKPSLLIDFLNYRKKA